MASENPLRRVPPNYGVMVTNTSQPPRGGGGAVVAAPSHLYYDDEDGGDGVEKLQGVWALAQPSVRTARKHFLLSSSYDVICDLEFHFTTTHSMSVYHHKFSFIFQLSFINIYMTCSSRGHYLKPKH